MRYTQPQTGPARVDWGNPLTRGLFALYSNGYESVARKTAPASDGSKPLLTPQGMALSLTGTNYVDLGQGIGQTGPVTYVFIGTYTGKFNNFATAVSLGDRCTMRIQDSNTPGTGNFYTFDGTGYSDTAGTLPALTITPPAQVFVAGVHDQTSGTNTYYSLAGGNLQSRSIAATPRLTGARSLRIGSDDELGRSIIGSAAVVPVWRRALTSLEILKVLQNPWQLFSGSASASLLPPAAVQLLRPSSDISAGTWTPSSGVNLFATINEVVADDATFDLTSQASTFEVGLTAGTSPGVTTGHVVRYRIIGAVTVSLKQGPVIIASWSQSPTAMTTYVQALTSLQAAAITNYAALSLQFQAT